MDVKKLILGMVGIMICAVMIGGALLPAMTAGEIHVTNDEGTMSAIEISDDLNFSFSKNDIEWTVNGVVQEDIYTGNVRTKSYIIADTFQLYADYSSDGTITNAFFIYQLPTNNGTVVNVSSATIEITNGTYTATLVKQADGASITVTGTFNWAYYGNDGGEYRIVSAPGGANYTMYMDNPENVRYSYYAWSTQGWFSGEGSNAQYNGEDVTPILTYTKMGEGVYSSEIQPTLRKTFAHITVDNNGEEAYLTPISYVVPYEVDGHVMGYSDVIGSMFEVIPLVAVAGLVLVGIYVFISRK